MEIEELLSKLNNLEKKIGYQFKNKNLFLKSMLHSSFVNEKKKLNLKSNERLEFLGDAVLELVISKYLLLNFKDKDEGTLSLKRAVLVQQSTLAKLSKSLRLHSYLYMGYGEKKSKGNYRDSVLSDTLEALLGAVFLDSDFKTSECLILKLFKPYISQMNDIEQNYNFKNQLQQYTQERFKIIPQYKLVHQSGPEHKKKFRVSIYLKNKYITFGIATSIKKAEQRASKNAINFLKQNKILKLN